MLRILDDIHKQPRDIFIEWLPPKIQIVMSQQNGVKEIEVKHEEANQQNDKENRLKLMTQKKSYRDKAIERRLNKKIICPLHKEKYILRCLDQGCSKPFVCLNSACIYAHQHRQHMIFEKFDSNAVRKNFDRAEKIISNNESMFDKARQIKNVIDGLKNTLTDLFKDLGNLSQVCSDLKNQVDSALTSSYLGRIDEVVLLESKIMTTLQTMKSKIIIPDEIPEFYLKNEVSLFLQKNIPNFKMETVKELIRIDTTMIETVKFEEFLGGRTNLIFLILCDFMVMGSYYQNGYPYKEQKIKDPASFIFLTDDEATNKIVKFAANPDCDCHIQSLEKCIISFGKTSEVNEGLIISYANPLTIDFLLPNVAYLSQDLWHKNYSGSLKWKALIVLQIQMDQ